MNESPARLPYRMLAAVAVATAVCHFVFGLLYATRWAPLPRTSASLAGEAYLKTFTAWDTEQEVDSAGYNRGAITAMRDGVPRTRSGTVFFRAAVYAYFLAGCYAIGGVRLLPVALAQAALSGLTCWFVGLAAGRIAREHKGRAMLLAGALVLFNPRLAMYAGYVYPTMLLMCLLAIALWTATQPVTLTRAVVIASALILGAFAQGAFFIVALAAGGWFVIEFVRRKNRAALVGAALIAAAVAGKFLLTWTAVAGAQDDYWRECDRGGTFWIANNPYYESMTLWSQWEDRPGNPRTTWRRSELEQTRYDRYLEGAGGDRLKATFAWIGENPRQYLKLVLIRLRTELGPFTGQMSPRNRVVSALVWLVIFPAGFFGLWKYQAAPGVLLAGLVVVAVIVFDSLVIVDWYLRYRLPADLALTVCAALTYASFFRKR
jgi:hypothetical protein